MFQGCLIRIDLQDAPHFDSLFGWQHLHSRFLLIRAADVDLFLHCEIKCSNFMLKFCRLV